MSRVRVDAALCVGHGRCYVLAPDVFGEDDRGHCVLQLAEASLRSGGLPVACDAISFGEPV